MLMNIKCSAIASIKVNLSFDDGSTKERVIGVGDLVDVLYNANGLRKHITGVVVVVSADGNDPNLWYIIVDSSDDFSSNKARFSPMAILDIEIIRKADTVEEVRTVIGEEGVPYIRIVRGQLQYSKDGYHWKPIRIYPRDIIEDAEGTVPADPKPPHPGPHPHPEDEGSDDGIEDADW